MSQEEVISILTEAKKPLGVRQIAKVLNCDTIIINHTLKRLLKWREVKCIEVDRFEAAKLLGVESPTRRMRFYYV